MKKIVILSIVIITSLVIGVLGLLTAIKLTTQEAVTPNAPEKPKAEEVPPPACTLEFTLNPQPTNTPGPSPTPTEVPEPSVTPTEAPGPTGTPKPNVVAKCSGLSASPTSGDVPLAVTFVGSGYDNNEGYIAGFDFNFGDGETKKIEQTFKTTDSYTITHTYTKIGTFIASVRIKDNNGDWSDIPDVCRQTIVMKGTGASVTPAPTTIAQVIPSSIVPSPTTEVVAPQIPQAGNMLPAIIAVAGGLLIAVFGWIAL